MIHTIYNACNIIYCGLCCKDIFTYHFACGLHCSCARVEEHCRLVATDSSRISSVEQFYDRRLALWFYVGIHKFSPKDLGATSKSGCQKDEALQVP
jgi:hypothetical protein